MQCGVACLAMICKYYKNAYSIETLSKLCSVSTEGVSLFAIKNAAEKLGFNSICCKTSIEQLVSISMPSILHWNQNHFVVLYKVKNKKKFYIADPGKGLVCYSLENFKKHWISSVSNGEEKGVVMVIEPTEKFWKKSIIEEPNKKRSFNFLFGYVLQYRKYFIQIIYLHTLKVFLTILIDIFLYLSLLFLFNPSNNILIMLWYLFNFRIYYFKSPIYSKFFTS